MERALKARFGYSFEGPRIVGNSRLRVVLSLSPLSLAIFAQESQRATFIGSYVNGNFSRDNLSSFSWIAQQDPQDLGQASRTAPGHS